MTKWSQEVYVKNNFDSARPFDCKLVQSLLTTHMNSKMNFERHADNNFVQEYQSHISTRIYANFTRGPDFRFAVSTLSQFLANLTSGHIASLEKV